MNILPPMTHQPLSYGEYLAHAHSLRQEGKVDELFDFADKLADRVEQLQRCKSFTEARRHLALFDQVHDWAEELDS